MLRTLLIFPVEAYLWWAAVLIFKRASFVECGRKSAVCGEAAAKNDNPLAVEVGNPHYADIAVVLQSEQSHFLAALRDLTRFGHVVHWQFDQFADGVGLDDVAGGRRLAPIGAVMLLGGPSLGL